MHLSYFFMRVILHLTEIATQYIRRGHEGAKTSVSMIISYLVQDQVRLTGHFYSCFYGDEWSQQAKLITKDCPCWFYIVHIYGLAEWVWGISHEIDISLFVIEANIIQTGWSTRLYFFFVTLDKHVLLEFNDTIFTESMCLSNRRTFPPKIYVFF